MLCFVFFLIFMVSSFYELSRTLSPEWWSTVTGSTWLLHHLMPGGVIHPLQGLPVVRRVSTMEILHRSCLAEWSNLKIRTQDIIIIDILYIRICTSNVQVLVLQLLLGVKNNLASCFLMKWRRFSSLRLWSRSLSRLYAHSLNSCCHQSDVSPLTKATVISKDPDGWASWAAKACRENVRMSACLYQKYLPCSWQSLIITSTWVWGQTVAEVRAAQSLNAPSEKSHL